MAANKFATMLHRNTNKITLILIYALLEWILILLLLLNSLFSYLIIKFADYFGLKRPCPWCSRVDQILEPQKGKNSHRDLLCEAHAAEVSKLGYCSNHRKLVESQDMCEDCSSSMPDVHGDSKDFALFPWVKQIGMVETDAQKVFENGEVGLNCSCCGVSIERKTYSPYILIEPTWGVLDYTKKGNLVTDSGDEYKVEEDQNSEQSRIEFLADRCENDRKYETNSENLMSFEVDQCFGVREDETEIEFSVSVPNSGLRELGGGDSDVKVGRVLEAEKVPFKGGNSDCVMEDPPSDKNLIQFSSKTDSSPEIPQHLEFFVGHDGFRLIPIEIIDSKSEENQSKSKAEEEDHEIGDNCEANLSAGVGSPVLDFSLGERVTEVSGHEGEGEPKFAVLESMEIEENENSLIFHAKECDLVRELYEQVATTQATQVQSEDGGGDGQAMAVSEEKETDSDDSPASEEVSQMLINNETDADVSIGTEIPDLDATDEIETLGVSAPYLCLDEEPSSTSVILNVHHDQGFEQTKEEAIECKTISVEFNERAIENHISLCSVINEIEEKRIPDVEVERVPDIEEEKIPDIEEEKILDVEEERVPVVEEEKICDVEEEKIPNVEEETVPDVAEEKIPNVEKEKIPDVAGVPDVEEEKIPDVEGGVPNVEEEKIPDVEEEKIPDVEEDRVPDIAEVRIPNVEEEKIPDVEEEKVPDTPTSVDSFQMHKKYLLLEKRDSATEESLDGSVISEFEGGESAMTVEHLKSALRTERKALHALYSELEEERSASAVAANQTMAMINRLQEEKAAMQMEALQYQRMMEEQSEYDQEALQLLNELMMKREREKQELEKELEIYRKKVSDYEARERVRAFRKSRDGSARSGTSSASLSNAEDSDELSVDLNQDAKEDETFSGNHENGHHGTPVDAVLNLEESLANFEEERLSILEQLKVLEEKLFTLSDEEDQHFRDRFDEENGDEDEWEMNRHSNGIHKEMNGKHHQEKRLMGAKAKRLLPLFDAIGTENEEGLLNGHENGDSEPLQNSRVTKVETDNKKIAIEEEVDNLYERLQALEADREFLKHCMGSLKKGDKGMHLLQEILQHLRDLRSVELRVKNLSDSALI